MIFVILVIVKASSKIGNILEGKAIIIKNKIKESEGTLKEAQDLLKKSQIALKNYKDNSKKTIKWLKNLGNPYSDVLIDKNGRVAIDWGVYGIPETFIVNPSGIIKYRHVGPITNKIYKKINLIINENE